MALQDKRTQVYAAIIKTVDGKSNECFIYRGSEPLDGWVEASLTPEMDSAIWFSQVNIISVELHELE